MAHTTIMQFDRHIFGSERAALNGMPLKRTGRRVRRHSFCGIRPETHRRGRRLRGLGGRCCRMCRDRKPNGCQAGGGQKVPPTILSRDRGRAGIGFCWQCHDRILAPFMRHVREKRSSPSPTVEWNACSESGACNWCVTRKCASRRCAHRITVEP
jgi:hypothetical protein